MQRSTTKDLINQLSNERQSSNQLTINLRTKNSIMKPQRSILVEKNQDKKKNPIKKQPYVPPVIMEFQAPKIMEYEWFKICIEDLLKYMKTQEENFMNIQKMYQIYQHTIAKGGIIQVSSINGFTSIARQILLMAGPNFVFQDVNAQFIEKIRQLLFSAQFINRNQGERKVYQLGLINFINKEQFRLQKKNKVHGLNYFNYDITLFQEGAQSLGIDSQIFNLDYICRHYGDQKIDIRIQNPLDYGFKPSKLKNKKYVMFLKDYRFYQLNFLDPVQMNNFKHTSQLGPGQVFFGVNFQPSDQTLNNQIKKNVTGTFLDFHGDFDLLSYLDTDVPGCSLPQMYFKTPGCWTGGHQQNVCMSALNINHGNGYSQWYTLKLQYVQRLRKELIQKYATDLYSSEGLWYQKLDWFIERGYPVKRFLQRADDIVVTGPGTLHWVRSFGVAIQTSWNICPKNYEQFQAAFMRHKINFQIEFSKSDTIPLKSLILKYLNHERTTMSQKIRILCVNQIQQWLSFQNKSIQKIYSKIDKRQYFYLQDLQSFCVLCRQQVLVYFVAAPLTMKKGISCLRCFQKSHKFNRIDTLYFKLDVFFVQMLIEICKNQKLNQQYINQIQQLCKGIHVGQIPIKCKRADNAQQYKIIKQNYTFADQNLIDGSSRQIFYGDSQKFQLYQALLFNHDKQKSKQQHSQIRLKQRLRPISKQNSGKMMMQTPDQGQICQMIEQKQQILKIDRQCQTQQKQQTKTMLNIIDKQDGQISNKSKQKKKNKHKSKKKKNKDRKKYKYSEQQSYLDSPRFKSDSQERKQASRQNNNSNDNYNNYNNYNNDKGNQLLNKNNNNYQNDYNNRDRNYDDNNNYFGNKDNRNDNYNNRNNYNNNYDNRNNFQNRGNRNNRINNNNNFNNNNNNDDNQQFDGQNGRKRNFNDRFNRDNNNQGFNRDRNDQRFNRDRNNEGSNRDWNNNNQGYNRYNNNQGFGRDRNNNQGFNRDRNNNDGSNRGERWRGGRGGRGGFFRENNGRYDGGGFNRDNEDKNKQAQNFDNGESNKPKTDEPDQY